METSDTTTSSGAAVAHRTLASGRGRARSLRGVVVAVVACFVAVATVPVSPAAAVVNGTEVTDLDERWTFIVRVGSESRAGCGGMLIAPEWVLTAAHCSDSTVTHVHYGSRFESALTAVEIKTKFVYPNWWRYFDMALMELTEPLSVKPARLGSTISAGDTVWTAGWGAVNTNGTGSTDVLIEGSMTVQDEADWPGTSKELLSYNIWAGQFGEADACYGDSGGPLINESGELVGVVSSGVPWSASPCGDGGLYTDLTSPFAQEWLESYIPGLFSGPDQEEPACRGLEQVAERILASNATGSSNGRGADRINELLQSCDTVPTDTDEPGEPGDPEPGENIAPVIIETTISPALSDERFGAVASLKDDLTCHAEAFDPDNSPEELTYSYEWLIYDIAMDLRNSWPENPLPSAQTELSDFVFCWVTVSDGVEADDVVDYATVLILD